MQALTCVFILFYIFIYLFIFKGEVAFRISLGLLCFLINCYEGGQTETSKLLENIQNLLAVYTNTLDQSHIFIFFFDLQQNMSLHLKYIILFIWEHNAAEIKDSTILNQICAFFFKWTV